MFTLKDMSVGRSVPPEGGDLLEGQAVEEGARSCVRQQGEAIRLVQGAHQPRQQLRGTQATGEGQPQLRLDFPLQVLRRLHPAAAELWLMR